MGHLIPAGTGIDKYRQMRLVDEDGNEIEAPKVEEQVFDTDSVNGNSEAEEPSKMIEAETSSVETA